MAKKDNFLYKIREIIHKIALNVKLAQKTNGNFHNWVKNLIFVMVVVVVALTFWYNYLLFENDNFLRHFLWLFRENRLLKFKTFLQKLPPPSPPPLAATITTKIIFYFIFDLNAKNHLPKIIKKEFSTLWQQ